MRRASSGGSPVEGFAGGRRKVPAIGRRNLSRMSVSSCITAAAAQSIIGVTGVSETVHARDSADRVEFLS